MPNRRIRSFAGFRSFVVLPRVTGHNPLAVDCMSAALKLSELVKTFR